MKEKDIWTKAKQQHGQIRRIWREGLFWYAETSDGQTVKVCKTRKARREKRARFAVYN